MGAGTYCSIVYGIASLDSKLEAHRETLEEMLNELGARAWGPYESSIKYFGITLLSTLNRDGWRRLSFISGPLAGLGERMIAQATTARDHWWDGSAKEWKPKGELFLDEAKRQWAQMQEKAKALGLDVPDGELILVEDYD